jgi:C1A family cysteine protease
LGGHALLVVGYDDATQCFTVRNSWGDSWGDKGYCYIPYKYLTNSNLSSDFWVLTKEQ